MTRLTFLIVSAVVGFAVASPGFAETYQIDPVHSRIGFSIRHLFSQVEGQFNDFSGTIRYDPENPQGSWVKAEIAVASVDTGSEKRDDHLRSADFFEVERFPRATFESTSVIAKGEGLLVRGRLTLHGVTREVVLPVKVLGTGKHPMAGVPVAGFQAESTLLRSEFGVDSWTDAADILGDEVLLRLNIEALAKAE